MHKKVNISFDVYILIWSIEFYIHEYIFWSIKQDQQFQGK